MNGSSDVLSSLGSNTFGSGQLTGFWGFYTFLPWTLKVVFLGSGGPFFKGSLRAYKGAFRGTTLGV